MLHPNTGIEIGKEVDEVRAENASLRALLSLAEKVVEAARKAMPHLLCACDAPGNRCYQEELADALLAYKEGKGKMHPPEDDYGPETGGDS